MPKLNVTQTRKSSASHSQIRDATATGILVSLALLSWCYKLETLPGLHGDEAWAGLEAYSQIHHPSGRVTGMNDYTGMLQVALSELSFVCFKVNVFYLRVGGVLFNLLGVIVFIIALIRKGQRGAALVFALYISQSALYLTSPRIGWEVNTFTLFFIACLYALAPKVLVPKANLCTPAYMMLCSLGSYNHIIFAAVPLSLLASLLMWSVYYGATKYARFLLVNAACLVNISLFFVTAVFFKGTLLEIKALLPAFLLAAIYVECRLVDSILPRVPRALVSKSSLRAIVGFALAVCAASFILFHGRAFFEALAGYKIYLQAYSYESSSFMKVTLAALALVFVFAFVRYLCFDLRSEGSSAWPFFIITYCGVLNMFTTQTSFRYYLALCAIAGVYLAVRLGADLRRSAAPTAALAVSLGITLIIRYQILVDTPRQTRAVEFVIGNGQRETSAHFLSKQPVVDFMRSNKAGRVDSFNENPYFIALPVQFYRVSQPWPIDSTRRVAVDYDFVHYGDGFRVSLER